MLFMFSYWFSSTFVIPSAMKVKPKRINRILLWAKMQTLSIIKETKSLRFGNMSIKFVTIIVQNLLKNFLWLEPSFSVDNICSVSKFIISSMFRSLKNLSTSCSFVQLRQFSTRFLSSLSSETPRSSKKYRKTVLRMTLSELDSPSSGL